MVASFSWSSKCKTVNSFHLIKKNVWKEIHALKFQIPPTTTTTTFFMSIWTCARMEMFIQCGERTQRQQGPPSYPHLDIVCSFASTKKPLVREVQWCLCSVCVCVLFVQTWTELCQHCALTPFSGADTVYMCVWWMTPTTTGAEGWMGQDTPKGFPLCYKKDMGGLHCMNNTLFTLYYVLSGIHTHLDNVSIHPQQLRVAKALLYTTVYSICEWMDLKPVMQIQQTCKSSRNIWPRKSILEPFMWNTIKIFHEVANTVRAQNQD